MCGPAGEFGAGGRLPAWKHERGLLLCSSPVAEVAYYNELGDRGKRQRIGRRQDTRTHEIFPLSHITTLSPLFFGQTGLDETNSFLPEAEAPAHKRTMPNTPAVGTSRIAARGAGPPWSTLRHELTGGWPGEVTSVGADGDVAVHAGELSCPTSAGAHSAPTSYQNRYGYTTKPTSR